MRILIAFIFTAFCGFTHAEFLQNYLPVSVEKVQITEILPALRVYFDKLLPGDIVVFDLDNTVFREAQMLGTDEWWQFAVDEMVTAEGISRREASNRLAEINFRIKSVSRMRLMEKSIPALIRELQDRGVWVMGLTARHPHLAEPTLRALRELGIDFERTLRFGSFAGFKSADEHQFLWRGGVAFTDGAPKGPAFREMMLTKPAGYPRKAVILDDRIDHVHSLIESMHALRIAGQVVHYLKSREEIFDPALARLQLDHFRDTGEILSDRRAQRRLDCMHALGL